MKKHYRRRPVSIRAELEETDTEFLLHIKPVSNAKAHQGLEFVLSTPKEGVRESIEIRDVIYGFLVSSFGQERAMHIIQSQPLEYWDQYVVDGVLDTWKVRADYAKDISDQGVEASTGSEEPEGGITAGLRPRSTTTVL